MPWHAPTEWAGGRVPGPSDRVYLHQGEVTEVAQGSRGYSADVQVEKVELRVAGTLLVTGVCPCGGKVESEKEPELRGVRPYSFTDAE